MIKTARGTTNTLSELIKIITNYVTDVNIHSDDAWQKLQQKAFPYGTIIKAPAYKEGEYMYLGMLFNYIQQGVTYNDWFYNSGEVDYLIPKNTASYTYSLMGENNGVLDIFKASADTLHFGIFKQFSEGLKWYEQGGKLDIHRTDLKLLPQIKVVHLVGAWGSYWEEFNSPVYPTVCYPALTMSDNNKGEQIQYWLVKDRHSLTVTIRHGKFWQSISFGLLKGINKETYPFPAYIGGGTIGLVGYGYTQNVSATRTYKPVYGMSVDYDNNLMACTNGNLLSAGKVENMADDRPDTRNNRIPSQMLVMTPSGEWDWFANYKQSFNYKARPSYNVPPSEYFFPTTQAERVYLGNNIYPNGTDKYELGRLYDPTSLNKVSQFLYPIYPVAGSLDSNYKEFVGFIPNNKMLSYKPMIYGEQLINGKKVLVIPNNVDKRVFAYPCTVGISDKWKWEELQAEYEANQQVSDMAYLVIELE